MADLTEKVAEQIRANLIPTVAAGIPWSKMEMGQDGYRKAAAAVIEMLAPPTVVTDGNDAQVSVVFVAS